MEREDILRFMTDCYKRGLGNRQGDVRYRTAADQLLLVRAKWRPGRLCVALILDCVDPHFSPMVRASRDGQVEAVESFPALSEVPGSARA